VWLSQNWFILTAILIVVGIAVASGPVIGLAVFLMAAGFVARYWARHVMDRVRYERIMPENRAFQGEKLSLTLRLVNDKPLPIPWIEVRDPLPQGVLIDEERTAATGSPGYVYLVRSTHLSWYERINWPLTLETPQRGYYRVGPARMNTGDIFGFNAVQRDEEDWDPFIIYPKVYTLTELGLPAERPFGELKGRQRIFEDPSRISGLRDYRPGDPMRRIDWKASARRQALQSKVYEPSATMHLLLAVNVHTMGSSWQGFQPETLERVLSAAASVARHGFDGGYAVGLVANGSYPQSDRPMRVPVGRRSDQLMRVLEALAVIHPLTLATLETIIDREAQRFPFGATLVCVTGQMDDPLAASLQRVSDNGHSVTVLSLAEREFTQDLGRIRVHNLSTVMKALEARDETLGATPS
jgi:uncharacterized protein (DUF58 family)